jgi:hypothetical protein
LRDTLDEGELSIGRWPGDNLTRVMNIVGKPGLIAAIRAA